MLRNTANQEVNGQLVDVSTGGAFSGSVSVYVTGDSSAQTLGTGSVTSKGNGVFQYAPTRAETDFAVIAYTFVATGAVPYTTQVATERGPTGSPGLTLRQIVIDALDEIGVVGADGVVSPEDLALGVRRANRLLDSWNVDGSTVYADTLNTFTLTPALQPHTIGPSAATWYLVQRPQIIKAASLVVDDIRYAMNIRQSDWWINLSVPQLTTSFPTDLYYDPAWPNGNIYLYPVPSAAYDVELLTRVVLTQLLVTDTFWLPPGYQEAFTLTLAEQLCAPLRVQVPQMLPMSAMKARQRVFAQNNPTPPMVTKDCGMPGGQPGWFDWRTGLVQ